MDNASIHSGSEMWDSMLELLEEHSIHLLFLPAYSPELNPCELCFAQLKNWLRNNRAATGGQSLQELIARAAARITQDNILNYYGRCLLIKDRFVNCEGDEGEEALEEEEEEAD